MNEHEGKYIFNHGIHRGTLMSRDVGNPEYFDTYEEAYQAYLNAKAQYARYGYQIWFASIKAPDGKETQLPGNAYYER